MSHTEKVDDNITEFKIVETITLTLDSFLRSESAFTNQVKCIFTFIKNSANDLEKVQLISLNDKTVNISLNPLEMENTLGFISSIQPLLILLNQEKVFVHLVVLYIPLSKGKPSAAILFNKNGSYIQTTKNWKSKFSKKFG